MKPKRTQVFVNGRFLTQRTTGVQRVAREIVRAIDHLATTGEIDGESFRFTLLVPRNAHLDLSLHSVQTHRIGHLRGQAWEQLELPFHSRGGVLLSLGNTGPLLARRQVVTMYDTSTFAAPSSYSRVFRLWYGVLLPRLGQKADRILTTSCFSRDELWRYLGIPANQIGLLPLGKEHILSTPPDLSILARTGIGQRPFVFAVGSRSPHKNFDAIVQAVELLGDVPYDFVFAGGTNSRIFGALSSDRSARAKELGYVTDAELRTLYEHACCFVFPSIYEGFGLPPLEAMTCGCPVISSTAGALPEVCGDAAIYFDPYKPADLAQRIREVMQNPPLREELSRRGLERARQFSWERSARTLMRVLDTMVVP